MQRTPYFKLYIYIKFYCILDFYTFLYVLYIFNQNKPFLKKAAADLLNGN